MRLSVIIPIYNVEKYLDECIRSVYCQSLDIFDFEILLIDDGSVDSSLSIANSWAEQYSNIRVFHQDNQGQAVARNYGLKEAKGDYVMFVDSDDYLIPLKLSGIMELIKFNDLDALIYNLQIQHSDGSSKIVRIPSVEYDKIYSGVEVALKYFVFGSMCRGIFRRSIFDKNNLCFNSGFTHEDSELCFRLYPLLSKVSFIDDALYFYRYNNNSTDRSKDKLKLRRNIESDAILVSKIFNTIEKGILPKLVLRRYRKIANSILATFFVRVRNEAIWDKSEFEKKIDWLRDIKVYPIKGKCNSWKTYALSKIFNNTIFLRLFLFGYR